MSLRETTHSWDVIRILPAF